MLGLDVFFFSSRRRHTRSYGDWSSDVCSSDLDDQGTSASSDTVTTGLTVWVAVGPGCQSSAASVQAGRSMGPGTVPIVASSVVPSASVVAYVPGWLARTITRRPS